MTDRQAGVRGAAGRAAPLFMLRCAALLAVLMWMLPVCAHAAGAAVPASAAVMPGSVMSTGTSGPAETTASTNTVHACPETQHGPGDVYCHPVSGAAASPASPVPVPSAQTADVTAAVSASGAPPAHGAPTASVRTPGIHQLQVQRI
ncbi:hypothetical protein OHU45_02600 [Streptomyces tubercidicus]|uniref:hypothetical protein n=1 Tax=Streptomyces tubercidicus TaxID=47759 RepID=UPI002E163731|nr:hypothetical protein OG761_02425 [Streptomyces tubercidicus]WSX24494.1 hypothetical protein OG690_34915 [Streptomyces tubercidicus]